MNKEELLQEISIKINTGEISREEVLNQLNTLSKTESVESSIKKSNHFSVNRILYIIGAAIVIIGIAIFVGQVWEDIGIFGRIAVTLGLGLLLALSGSILLKHKPEEIIGSVFHFMGGLLIPSGAMVMLSELKVDLSSLWPLVIVFGFISAFYLALSIFHKNSLLTFFSVGNGTAFIYLLVEAMIAGSYYTHTDLYAYLTMLMGVSYLLLGKYFQNGWNKKITEVFYFFGSIGFLGAAFSRVFDSTIWQGLFVLFVLAGLLLSIYIKSRKVLVISTLFLIAHISYLTSKYFADSLGWPICLIILGFIFIGLGYSSISLSKKYIKKAV